MKNSAWRWLCWRTSTMAPTVAGSPQSSKVKVRLGLYPAVVVGTAMPARMTAAVGMNTGTQPLTGSWAKISARVSGGGAGITGGAGSTAAGADSIGPSTNPTRSASSTSAAAAAGSNTLPSWTCMVFAYARRRGGSGRHRLLRGRAAAARRPPGHRLRAGYRGRPRLRRGGRLVGALLGGRARRRSPQPPALPRTGAAPAGGDRHRRAVPRHGQPDAGVRSRRRDRAQARWRPLAGRLRAAPPGARAASRLPGRGAVSGEPGHAAATDSSAGGGGPRQGHRDPRALARRRARRRRRRRPGGAGRRTLDGRPGRRLRPGGAGLAQPRPAGPAPAGTGPTGASEQDAHPRRPLPGAEA